MCKLFVVLHGESKTVPTLVQFIKSRTILFATALAVLGVVEANVGVFQQYMTPQTFGVFSVAVGVIVAVLRVLTTVPLSEK